MSSAGKRHLQRVADYGREAGCIVCGHPFAHLHHILEGRTPGRKSGDWCVVPLCVECHTGTHGIHGTRQRWSLFKAHELEALDRTLEAIYGGTR
jgi:hypothetical protein